MRVAIAAALAALIHAPAVAKPPSFAKESISRASKDGAVMLAAPIVFGDYTIMLSPYSAETGTVRGLEFVNIRQYRHVPAPSGLGSLQIHRMPPGHYVVRMVTMQGYWGACLSGNTFGFDVKAGEITYVGRIDPSPTLASIEAEARRTGKVTSSGGQLRLFNENVLPPQFSFAGSLSPADAIALARANGFVTDSPVVSVKPEAISYRRIDKTGIAYCK